MISIKRISISPNIVLFLVLCLAYLVSDGSPLGILKAVKQRGKQRIVPSKNFRPTETVERASLTQRLSGNTPNEGSKTTTPGIVAKLSNDIGSIEDNNSTSGNIQGRLEFGGTPQSDGGAYQEQQTSTENLVQEITTFEDINETSTMNSAIWFNGSAISVDDKMSSVPPFLVPALQNSDSSPTAPVPEKALQYHSLGSLLTTVLSDYDRRLRPRYDQARFVTIFSDFVPLSIIDFNTREQRFSVMGYFKMDWRDDFLTWEPSMYEGTEHLRIPVQSIWIPKLSIDKSYDGDSIVGDTNTDIALINYKGYVRWFPEGIYSVVCQVTIRFYPFDIQTCIFSYTVKDEDNSTVNLKHDGVVDLTEYIENAEWKLNSLTATREQVDTMFVVKYQFDVERRGGFAMFTLVVPVLMLSTLSGATFLIPIESGEKCSFSVTIFLAYGIFETVVIDTLPHNSMDVSYFILYLTSLLIVSVLLTFYTILQAKIFDAIGDRQFRVCRGSNPDNMLTWGTFLRKLDTYIFAGFLVLVLGFTSIFIAVMEDKFDFL